MTATLSLEQLNERLINCRKCPRLVEWREEVAAKKRKAYLDWDYWGKPVPGFGDISGRVMVVGLAPGAHGSNRTGRMFTGDASGDFLYAALYKAGFANQAKPTSANDGLVLSDLFITAVCRCTPPRNKPQRGEIDNCREYLDGEFMLMKNLRVIVALGSIAFHEVITMLERNLGIQFTPRAKFSHGHVNCLSKDGNPILFVISSYHPSRQNTQTGRLTKSMFDEVWDKVNQALK